MPAIPMPFMEEREEATWKSTGRVQRHVAIKYWQSVSILRSQASDENEKNNKNILAAGRKHGMLALHY